MDTNKILSADFLDILFDNRNKSYGAYELRRTYSKRITRSLIFTGVFVSLISTGVVLGNKIKPDKPPKFKIIEDVILTTVDPDEPEPEPIPEPPRRQEEPQIRTEPLTTIAITRDEEVDTSPPSQADLKDALIGLEKIDGIDFDGTMPAPTLNDPKKIIEEKRETEPQGPLEVVHIEAKFDGDWRRFLERNLNPQVAIDNNAPPGQYTVLIQFVVDVDGTISDIKALNNPGYGLEQEAIRVIKKSKKWEPAIQHGRAVKAYRKQPITFQITDD